MSQVTPYAFLMSFVARMVELAAAFSTGGGREGEIGERERERERKREKREREGGVKEAGVRNGGDGKV